jgi:hypothetical protein
MSRSQNAGAVIAVGSLAWLSRSAMAVLPVAQAARVEF